MIEQSQLVALEALVQEALRTGDESTLDIVGYGEVTTVLRWPREEGAVAYACKRLPRFPSPARFEEYVALFDDCLAALREGGVEVVDSTLFALPAPGEGVTGYCVQPLLPAQYLAPQVLAAADAAAPGRDTIATLETIAATAVGVCSPALGIDGQCSNWAWLPTTPEAGDGLRYFDVTTPFLRDAEGRWRLDLDVFGASLPAVLRRPLLRFVFPGIEAKYHEPRHVLLDFAGNLHKEGLAPWLRVWLPIANALVDPPITEAEVTRFYRDDARTWAVMQRIRQWDRTWQRRVRRRPYPFLLPGPIDR